MRQVAIEVNAPGSRTGSRVASRSLSVARARADESAVVPAETQLPTDWMAQREVVAAFDAR